MRIKNVGNSIVAGVNHSILLSFAIVLVSMAMISSSSAQSDENEFVPFQKFIATTAAASSGGYMSLPDSRVQDPTAFDEMRRYILTMYQGVKVEHSMVEGGQYFDCVPVTQQPSARLLGISQIDAPPAELPSGLVASNEATTGAAFDRFGNSLSCEKGTIPMRRLMLEELTRFATLGDFLQRGRGPDPQGGDVLPPAAGQKRYATELQKVDNLGTISEISLWDPPVGEGDEFSLAQQWISGGTGDSLQTIEGGWIKYPFKFKDTKRSVLFIFYTSNNYKKGFGCYNLECAGFMQTDDSWKLGSEFPAYSVSGGAQHWFTMEWYFVSNGRGQKNWWLLLKHDNDAQATWVGYYPEKIFNGGQMSKNADELEYGGETDPAGNTWPAMGSGAFPINGWTKAAFQSNIKYTDLERNVKAVTLKVNRQSAFCYLVGTPPVQTVAAWGTYFFFGGPGGNNCP